jgi:uncharacterized RDD family membrane protein YckC
MASQPNPAPAWKQEVNRRLAEHKSRKGLSVVAPSAGTPAPHAATTRAAQAAARVAARYAQAPSYSELQAAEARTAVRAAEIATEVALDAQAAAKQKLARLEAACAMPEQTPAELPKLVKPEPPPPAMAAPAIAAVEVPALAVETPVVEPAIATPPPEPAIEMVVVETRREAPAMVQPEPPSGEPWRSERTQAESLRQEYEVERLGIEVEDWWRPAPAGVIEPVEPDQPIHANLIEFPRELVAQRKSRTHHHEQAGVAAADPVAQLSIFEVDPGAMTATAVAEPPAAQEPAFAWSGMRLDAEQYEELAPEPVLSHQVEIELAPFGRRLLAAVVDATLIAGAFMTAAVAAASRMEELPALRTMEMGTAAGLLLVALSYLALFTTLGSATPGMKYAGICLRTLDDRRPTRAQRCGRLGALLLSVLPVGLGLALAIFDEDHLTWHDRLSGTYQKRA